MNTEELTAAQIAAIEKMVNSWMVHVHAAGIDDVDRIEEIMRETYPQDGTPIAVDYACSYMRRWMRANGEEVRL